jgi:radical SAM superfamily enzyme YgiQ (UPF0313 family)
MGIKVFLGNSPWNKPGFYGVRAGSRWPHFESEFDRYMPFPFQLAYAAALLETKGIEVLLVDGIAEKMTEDEFISRIASFAPDLVLLEVSTPSFDTDLKIANRLKAILADEVRLAFCGPHLPMSSPDFLDRHPDIDLAFIGEYELTLTNMALALQNGTSLNRISGLLFKDRHGKSISTGTPDIIQGIDSMPLPARHFLPMHNYFDNPGDIPEPSLQMWGSRGCPFSCSYCIWPQLMNGSSYRPRDVNSILDEMEQVCAEYDFRSVYFDDDTFNIGKKRMLDFCKEKIRRGLDIPWAIMARADLMDQEILEAMAEAGIVGIKYGIESAEPQLLENVSKHLNLEKAIENVHITKNLGIKVHLTFMFGIPGETKQTVRKTVALAKKLNPDSIQFSILTPLPGTRIFDELKTRGHLVATDCDKFDGYFSSAIRTTELSEKDLEKSVRWAWRSWFAHKLIQQLTLKDIKPFLRLIPRYLRNPVALHNQLKRLLHV